MQEPTTTERILINGYRVMKILIDNGHGIDTPGKRSPDGVFREYRYTREIATEVVARLRQLGYDAERLVPEDSDVSLTERCRRANDVCTERGTANVVLVSIHCNAKGMGRTWENARGWCAFTSKGKTRSDELAEMLYTEADKRFVGHKIRRDRSDGDSDWEANFTILSGTRCTAVLTENFFQDNREDVAYLLSDKGRRGIIEVHVNALINFVKKYGNKK